MSDQVVASTLELFELLEQPRPLARWIQTPTHAGLHGNVPARALRLIALMHASVARIAEGGLLFAVEQRARLRHITHVGSRADHRVDESRFGINTDVGLHSKMVSRPRELPPQPLAEPYVTLSRHTAPVIQPAVR